MKTKSKTADQGWPRKVQPGRNIVTVYRRQTASGVGYMLADYIEGQRRFRSFNNEQEALDAADTLAKRLDARNYVAASMSENEAIEYANSKLRLAKFNVTIDDATATVTRLLPRLGGNIAKLDEAVAFYIARHRPIEGKTIADAAKDFIESRQKDGASARYTRDLKFRLDKFAEDCTRQTNNVSSLDIQRWLDGLNLSKQSKLNYKRVLRTFFEYCRTRGLCLDNPVNDTAKITPKRNPVDIFTPDQARKLLGAATQEKFVDFLPALAISLFAGLRSSEIERVEWTDIDLVNRVINLDASKTKTANGRTIPVSENLAQWLAPYAARTGRVWPQPTSKSFSASYYGRQYQIANAAGLKWHHNAARHSFISYRLIQLGFDSGRVAGEAGNSSAMINRHYKTLIKTDAANKAAEYFAIAPDPTASNVVPMAAAASLAQ